MNLKHVDERYRNDPKFHQLVKMLEMQIIQGEFTPSEIREAVLLAQLKYEMEHPRMMTISEDLRRHIEFMSKDSKKESK